MENKAKIEIENVDPNVVESVNTLVSLISKLDLAFCLLVGPAGAPKTLCWSNLSLWGQPAVDNFNTAWHNLFNAHAKKTDQEAGSLPTVES